MTSTAPGKPSFLHASFGGLPRPFWALWGGTLVNRLGSVVMPFMGVFLTQARGLPVATAGLVMAVFGAGSLLSQLLAGMLADRIGRRATLAGGMVATAAGLLALGYSTTLPAILASTLALGLVVDAYRPASNALLADLVPPETRPRAYGLLFWAVNLGYSIGMTAGGWLAQQGFLLLFWLDAVSCLVFAVLVWRAVPETRPAARTGTGGFGVVLRDRLMVAYTLVMLGDALVYAQTYTMLPVAMTGLTGMSTGEFGTAMALNGVLIVLVQPLVSNWLGRRDAPRTLAAGMAVLSAGFALTAFVTGPVMLAVTVAVWTVGEIVAAGFIGTIVARLAPAHLRGRYSGLYGFAVALAGMLAPLLGSVLLEAGGPHALWFTVGGIGLVSAAGMLAIGPAIRRR